jgi:hypothetical protein
MARVTPQARLDLTASELLLLLEEAAGGGAQDELSWIPLKAAALATGIPERTLRDRAERWDRLQDQGKRPEIRVSKTGTGEKSHWRFRESDCEAYAEAHPPVEGTPVTPLPVRQPAAAAEQVSEDEAEATVAMYASARGRR